MFALENNNPELFIVNQSHPNTYNLKLESTLAELSLYEFEIESSGLGVEVAKSFEANPLLPGVILTENGNFVGMISRQRFLEYLLRPYGIELFLKRPIKSLYRFAHRECLIFSVDTLIVLASRQALQRPLELIYEPLVVEIQPSVYRLLDVHQLLVAQSQIHDLTTKLLDELERINRLKDDFLNAVSHELRTPLANMKMVIELLTIALKTPEKNTKNTKNTKDIKTVKKSQHKKSESLSISSTQESKVSRYLQILQKECDREINLVNDLLDLQRLEAAAHPRLKPQEIYLHEWVRSLVQPFIERAICRQQNLLFNISSDLPPLKSDPTSLARILTELLNNACKYTPVGEKIMISAETTADAMQIIISNTGVEIPPAEIPRIFDKFYRIPNANTEQQCGTGLGLSLVKKLVNHLGGTISVESDRHQTSFTVSFPLTKVI